MKFDLRSDTVTRPTESMLEAMMKARVGDDVFGEDSTVNELEEKAAAIFGKEAGLFCPSGTMTNQIAIKLHTQPGDEVICHREAHIYQYEGGGIAFNAGCSVHLIDGDRGRVSLEDVKRGVNPDDVHKPVSTLVAVEDTSNRGGGAIYNVEELQRISGFCRKQGLAFHLDGARVFNSLVETGVSSLAYGQMFDTISVCLSKGLGCPVGSVLLGSKEHIRKARRIRKVFGGGMRQAGYLAAAGIYALDHHVERLKDDHQRARKLASALIALQWVEVVIPVETNIVVVRLTQGHNEQDVQRKLMESGVLGIPFGKGLLRFVLHLHIGDSELNNIVHILNQVEI